MQYNFPVWTAQHYGSLQLTKEERRKKKKNIQTKIKKERKIFPELKKEKLRSFLTHEFALFNNASHFLNVKKILNCAY